VARIIYTGCFCFPDGDAAAARVLGIGNALRAAGHEVIFAGWEDCGRSVDLQNDGTYLFQGFQYISQNEFRFKKLPLLQRLKHYLMMGKNTLRWLSDGALQQGNIVIVNHGFSLFLFKLLSLCKQRNAKLIIDCTEWYEPSHLIGGRFGLVRLDNEIRMRLINSRIGWVLPISSYLENFYATKKCCVLRIPPLVDIKDLKWAIPEKTVSRNHNLRLIYAGSPGKKDLLDTVLRGLCVLRDEGVAVELHLVGPSREAVANCLGSDASILDSLADATVFHGRVPQSEVPRLLATADFSILIRPRQRYAEAGFPTKLVESLSAGVPVIANPTSDIAEYVQDGKEGILLTDHSVAAFVVGVKRALAMSHEQVETMSRNAFLRAEASFDYRRYVEQLEAFVQARMC